MKHSVVVVIVTTFMVRHMCIEVPLAASAQRSRSLCPKRVGSSNLP